MNIIRLVVLGILFYIAWRLLQGIFNTATTKATKTGNNKKEEVDPTVQDILVEDPECRKLVPKSQAVTCRIDGETYYFCSDTCCDNFSDKQRKKE